MTTDAEGRLAVAVHDVEPATFERCALIRDWLADQGVDRATLLVVPASDMHPFDRRSPELAEWLAERRAQGDAIAQQGFCGCSGGDFGRLDARDARRTVEAGRRLLHLAGVEPRGFVAPAYAYTPALHEVLALSHEWWAGLKQIHRRAVTEPLAVTAISLRRLADSWLPRGRAAHDTELLRLDIRPDDLDGGRRVARYERILRRERHRVAVTYDTL